MMFVPHDKKNTGLDETPPGTGSNDIAVIGMAGRFPMAGNLEEFWMNLKQGKYCVGEVPEARVEDWRSLYGESIKDIPQLGYLPDISQFDSHFFNIPPGEAILIDPAQRLLIEVVYHALEYGGYGGKRIANTRTGVFVACSNSRYRDLISPGDYSMTAEVGNLPAVSVGRVSHFFDLRGPSLLIDTACSSSLTAMHYACQSLKRGECSMAVLGAVNIYAYLGIKEAGSKENEKTISNRLRVFDDSTSGVLSGEGVGALLLKPLPRALKDKDVICAVIKGTALSHSGARTATITGQKPEALAEVIRLALENANVSPEAISYIEASGTATTMGDPIEIKAISDVFSTYTDKKQFCAIGSVKSNLGHLNHASGLASLIKVILALQHKQIPPLARFKKPNAYIDFKNSPVYIETELNDWELGENNTRRAGISSFSVNGTNCHVIMEEAPPQELMEYPDHANILTVSAKNPGSLQKLCSALKKRIENDTSTPLNDVCYTMNTGRGHHEYRLAAVGKNKKEFIHGLETANHDILSDKPGREDAKPEPKAVFLFPGGNLSPGLLETCRDFYRKGFIAQKYMEECGTLYDLEKYPHALVFSFQYALAKLWMDLGIKPAFVLGFGIGKYVSRVITGKLNLEQALNICVTEYNRENFFNLNKEKLTHHIAQLYSRGHKLYLEIGPENQLSQITKEQLKIKNDGFVLSSYESENKEKALLDGIAFLYNRGVSIDFSSLFPGKKAVLPLYPFDDKSYWVKIGPLTLAQKTTPGDDEVTAVPLKPRPELSTEYTAPNTKFEKDAVETLKQFLGINRVGIHDSFFELGINSLSMLHINNRLKKVIQKDIPIVSMFEYPTIYSLGQLLERLNKEENGKHKEAEQVHDPQKSNTANTLLHNSINILRNKKRV